MKCDRKYKYIGSLGKTKYYVTADGWLAKAGTNKKFIDMGYIDDNWSVWTRLCNEV